MAPKYCRHCGLVQCQLHMNQFASNPRSGSRCPAGALTTTSVLAATGRLDHPSIASYNRHGLREKLSGRPAKSEVPDTVAPTHSTASRGRFATLGNPPDISIIPKPYNARCPKICAALALVVLISLISHPLRAVHRLRCERVSPIASYRSPTRISAAKFLRRYLCAAPVSDKTLFIMLRST